MAAFKNSQIVYMYIFTYSLIYSTGYIIHIDIDWLMWWLWPMFALMTTLINMNHKSCFSTIMNKEMTNILQRWK